MPQVGKVTSASSRQPVNSGRKDAGTPNGPSGVPRQTASNIFDAAIPVEDLPHLGHKFLIFGASGTGKTTLACTAPKPCLLVRPEEVEDGSKSVRKVAGISVTPPLTNPDQLLDVVRRQRETQRYKSIILDGADRFQDLVLRRDMGLEDVPVQLTWGVAKQSDWNVIGIAVKEYFRSLMRLADEGVHIVFVAGERTIKAGQGLDSGENASGLAGIPPKVMASLAPSVTGFVHAMCDCNVYTFKRKGFREEKTEGVIAGQKTVTTRMIPTGKIEFCAIIGPDPDNTYATKFRLDKRIKLPGVMVDPDFAKMDALIRGG